MKKIALVFGVLVFASGCTSMQKSVYTNKSTPYGNEVYATGEAAVAAAGVNGSYNCPSCAVSGSRGNRGQYPQYRYQRKQRSHVDDIYNSATQTLSNEISRSINDAIRRAF